MQDRTERVEATGQNYRGWQSDVIVDLIKRYGFPHITLNPGASFRGLHDSLVNYGGNQPPMMLCQHEEIAVQIAHGYAKATGKPMAVILHNLVGLLHACMAIYYAYIDRVPIFIIGATGPMDEGKRRPHIDWTALGAGAGERGARLREVGLPADRDRRRAGKLCARLLDHDHGAAGPGLYVLRRRPAGGAARRRGGAAAGRRGRDPGADGARSGGDRGDRGQADRGRAPAAAGGICRPPRGRLRKHRGARRDHRRGGVGRQQRAQFSQQASAVPEHGQGHAAAHRPGRGPRRQRLGKAAHRAQQRQAHARTAHAAVVRFRRDRLRRDQHQQVGFRLLPHAAVLGAGAGRHRARHPRAHPHLQGAHCGRFQAPVPHRRAQARRRQAPRRGVGEMAAGGARELGRVADHLRTTSRSRSGR